MTTTIGEAIALGKATLKETSDSPAFDTELLLCHTLDTGRATLIAWPERELSSDDQDQFIDLLTQRSDGTPIAYLLGEREFWSLDLHVTPDVLIPRPDTELLVEIALELGSSVNTLKESHANASESPNTIPRVADLGTGSGAIALALCHEKPHWHITATDLSAQALHVARDNAKALEMPSIQFKQGRWCEALERTDYHLIISNPPYIRDNDPHLNQGDLRFEPPQALSSGESGLEDIIEIIDSAQDYLTPEGWLLLEHGYDQHREVQQLLAAAGYQNIETQHDLSGIPRASMGQNAAATPPASLDIDASSETEDNKLPLLNDTQVRVLGSLIEKSLTHPDHYPLTLTALQGACNQKTGRRPVMQLDTSDIEESLNELLDLQLIRVSTDRYNTPHFRHRIQSALGYNKAQISILGILLLRGSHTPSDLLLRTEHLFTFANPQHVEKTLCSLASHGDYPSVLKLKRSAHALEPHWAHTLSLNSSPPLSQPDLMPETPQKTPDEQTYLHELEQRVSELEDIVSELSQPANPPQ